MADPDGHGSRRTAARITLGGNILRRHSLADSPDTWRGLAEELPGPCGVLRTLEGHVHDRSRGADQQSSNSERALKSKDRFILGAIVFAALIGGLLLCSPVSPANMRA
jgi:hypothetical protein